MKTIVKTLKGKKVLSLLLAMVMMLSVASPAFSPMMGIIAKAAASYPVELAFENIFVFEQWASNKNSIRIDSDADGGEKDGAVSNIDVVNGSFRLTNNINTHNVYTTASMGNGDTADENGAFYSMAVEEGVTYNLDYNVTGNAPGGFFPYVFFYDEANNFISAQNGAATGYGDNRFTFTVPEDMTHIQVRFTLGPASSGSAYVDLKNIAIYKTETVDAPITELFDFDTWSTKTGSGAGTSVYGAGSHTATNGNVTITSNGADNLGGCSAYLTNFSLGAYDDTAFVVDTQPGKTYILTYTLSDITFNPANSYLSALIPWYNSSSSWIESYGEKRSTEAGKHTYTFTVPSDVYHFQVVFGLYDFSKTNGVGATVANISLYEVVEDSIISHKVDPIRKVYTYTPGGSNTYGTLPNPPAETIPDGYIFAGWYTGKDGTGIRIAPDTEIQPMSYTVYPKFEPAVDSLVVTTPPAKTEYTVGEKLNTSDLVLTATIDDGSGAEGSVSTFNIASGYYCTPEYLTATGTQTITAHYGGKTATFTVNVSAGVEKNIVVNGATQAVNVANNEYILNYQAPSPFNRYEMTYSSDSYVKGEISMDDGIIEEFFLEPSDNGSFASYIDSFIKNVNHYGIDSIKFTCLNKEYGNFELKSLTTISSPVPSDPMQYYENDEYKVGISLDFGGVVSYIEDLKNKPVARVYNENGNNITKVDYANKLSASGVLQESSSVNLINTWDRGRYLQQSYYGTYDKPYNLGNYNGLDWNYNPVQGGNIKGDASKVIDYRITDDQIYVKTRPLDWGKWSENYGDEYVDEYITDSYMEAWYVFEDGMIKTYCRFVDYSGYPSNTTTQEFPALYTIEPLNHFVYNEVDEAWSEDNLVKIEEPEFWGILPDYNALLQANGMSAVNPDRVAVENWAAFTASDDADSFGIGVYSPGVTDMHFGTYPAIYNEQEVTNNNRLVANYRHAQTVDPAVEGPTSYIAPVDIMTFESYKPSTYSYYITTGTAEEIHNDFETVAKKDSQAELDKSKIAVPETVYMTPADGASKVGQYYVNNIMDEDDNYNIKTEAVRDAGMYLGLHIKDAKEFSVKVTNVTDPSNDIFLCNTSGSEISESTRIPFEAAGTYENDTQYGLRFSGTGLAPGEKATAKWEITVYLEDGTTETYTAYTVLYAPGRTVGAVAEARQVDASQNEISSWITGANGVDHSQRAPLGSFHGDISASGYFKEDPLYSAVPASGSGGTANDYINVDSENTYVLQTATNGHDGSRAQSYLGLLTVDKSRYTNTNQIPNLQIGYDVLRKGSYTNNSIGKYTTYYTLGTESAYTATSLSDAPSGWTVYSGTYTDFASDHSIPYRESFVPSFDVSTIDGKYIHALNQALADQTVNTNQYSTAGTSVLCSVTDKSELRDAVLEGYTQTNTNPEFDEALKEAGTVLGDPSATQTEIDDAKKDLNNAMEEVVETFYALKYDNIFSAYELSQKAESMTTSQPDYTTVGYEDGVITVKNEAMAAGETYTRYGSSDDFYKVALQPNTEYVFEYDVTTTEKAQAFMFFYNASGGNGDVPTNMSVKTNSGSWGSKSESNTWWGNYTNSAGTYHYAIKFTTGANTTQASFRFGNTSSNAVTSSFSNIKLVDAAHYYEDVTYSATEAVYKEFASYGTMATATRPGYTFSGWEDASGNSVTGANIATDHLSVYSTWNEKTYTVIYNKNGDDAVGSADAKNATHFEEFSLPDNFSRKYYKFRGWAYTADAVTPAFTPGQTVSISDFSADKIDANNTVTLYAIWERGYSLYFSPNNGTGEIPGSFMGYTEPHNIPENTTITRTGYTFLGWSLDPNATTASYVAGDTLTVSEISSSYIQTDANDANEKFVVLHAVWRANARPSVTFDNLIDMPSWEKLTANNATASDFTGSGFTLTSTVGAGEGTFESPYFDVEPGKQYKIDMDFEGGAWDVYIFFCDANGNWIEFSDSGNRFSSNGGGNQTRIFTAPNNNAVVKAKIRVDANGSANTVKFNNIRVYEVGTVEEGVSYETAKTVTYGTAYGELPVPTRYGYDFVGWVNAAGEPVTAATIMNSEKTVNLFSKWNIKAPQLVSDTVVIDFGLPVKINVLVNDINMSGGTLTAVGTGVQGGTVLNTDAYDSSRLTGKADTLALANGTAAIDDNNIVYRPNGTNYTSEIVFYYEYQTAGGQYYYTTVTVIPATSIYFEETMFTFTDSKVTVDGEEKEYKWQDIGTSVGERFQAEDRPGTFTFADADADNVYGADSAYSDSTTYSMGSAKFITVDQNSNKANPLATASFTFTGTGFDLFTVTDNKAGLLTVSIYKDGTKVKGLLVNTYYGYTYDEDANDGQGGYVASTEDNALFQVPAIRARDLEHGTYTVVVEPKYSYPFDVNLNYEYRVYVDSVRIYDPMGTENDVANDAYLADGEYAPDYLRLRDTVVTKGENNEYDVSTYENSSLFFDGYNPDLNDVTDVIKNGPKNEVYLAKGQAVAFNISATSNLNIASVQLGMKLINANGNAQVTVMNTEQQQPTEITLTSATEQFYKLDSAIVWDDEQLEQNKFETAYPVVILNSSDADVVISLTSLKWAFEDAGADISTFSIIGDQQTLALAPASIERALTSSAVDPVAPENVAIDSPDTIYLEDGKGAFTITTEAEITKVTVNGVELTDCEINEDGQKTWKYSFEAEEAGENVFEIVVYDDEGNQSETITNTINVVDDDGNDGSAVGDGSSTNGIFANDWIKMIFDLIGKILELLGGALA